MESRSSARLEAVKGVLYVRDIVDDELELEDELDDAFDRDELGIDPEEDYELWQN